jgi:hypothetical protein
LVKRSSAGMTVVVDPIKSFEGVVLGSCRLVTASALAASDIWPGKRGRAPTLGLSRPVGTFNTASPEVSAFSGRAKPTSYQPPSSGWFSAKFSNVFVALNPLLSIVALCQAP